MLLLYFVCQAPSNMKAVLQAGWLLTTAMGNFIVLIVAQVAKLEQRVRYLWSTTAYKHVIWLLKVYYHTQIYLFFSNPHFVFNLNLNSSTVG